jgi:hypothetical protein
MQVYG